MQGAGIERPRPLHAHCAGCCWLPTDAERCNERPRPFHAHCAGCNGCRAQATNVHVRSAHQANAGVLPVAHGRGAMQRTFTSVPCTLRRLQRMQSAGNERSRSSLRLRAPGAVGETQTVPACGGLPQTVSARGQLSLGFAGDTNDSRDPFRHVDLQSQLLPVLQ